MQRMHGRISVHLVLDNLQAEHAAKTRFFLAVASFLGAPIPRRRHCSTVLRFLNPGCATPEVNSDEDMDKPEISKERKNSFQDILKTKSGNRNTCC